VPLEMALVQTQRVGDDEEMQRFVPTVDAVAGNRLANTNEAWCRLGTTTAP
jgi:hypothetical protein